ncbi:MAG: FHA domain-containing protein [Rhodocyclaceae bacterium]|nr:MAG: FHA domain-containing protein [Rhodocyclaceae bacterium]
MRHAALLRGHSADSGHPGRHPHRHRGRPGRPAQGQDGQRRRPFGRLRRHGPDRRLERSGRRHARGPAPENLAADARRPGPIRADLRLEKYRLAARANARPEKHAPGDKRRRAANHPHRVAPERRNPAFSRQPPGHHHRARRRQRHRDRQPRGLARKHCRIVIQNDSYVLVDESTNGTYISPDQGAPFHIKRKMATLAGAGWIALGHLHERGDKRIVEFTVRKYTS